MNIVSGMFITLCWLIYVIYWFASSFSQKPASEKPQSAVNFIDKFFSFAAFAVLIKPDWFYLSAVLVKDSLASGITGMAMCALGLVVCIWARKNLAGNWSFTLDFKKGHELVRAV